MPRRGSASCSRSGTTASRSPTWSSPARPTSVGSAIDLLQRYGISQLPVTEQPEGSDLAGIVGSVSEKGLLDRAYRNPEVVARTVGEVMDRPLPTLDVGATVDEAFALLTDGARPCS